jgi:excisionase family DNA binding protein
MNITIELTPDQLDAIAAAVAERIGQGRGPSKGAYTATEVAKLLGLSAETIRRRIRAGQIKTMPLRGGVVRISATEIERLSNA